MKNWQITNTTQTPTMINTTNAVDSESMVLGTISSDDDQMMITTTDTSVGVYDDPNDIVETTCDPRLKVFMATGPEIIAFKRELLDCTRCEQKVAKDLASVTCRSLLNLADFTRLWVKANYSDDKNVDGKFYVLF